MAARKGDGGETKRKWEKEENQDSEKWQSERRSCLEGSQTPALQPENRPVWLSLLVLYSSTRPGRRFIVAITQIPLAFIPSLDASGLYSITVSIYRWKKKIFHTGEMPRIEESPPYKHKDYTETFKYCPVVVLMLFHAESKLETWSAKCSTRGGFLSWWHWLLLSELTLETGEHLSLFDIEWYNHSFVF